VLKIIKRILIVLLIVLIGMQFISIDKTNPETNPNEDFVTIVNPPADIIEIMKVSCNDCHSHQTRYPWYSNIAPVSFWLKDHIKHGRGHLNFSIWGTYEPRKAHHKLEECFEEVKEGHMPLPSYLWTHKDARLSEAQRERLAGWFKEQMARYE
jgi:hypothetical protein